jgi:hypothetical protein
VKIKVFFQSLWGKITSSSLVGRLLAGVIVLAVMIGAMILSGPKPPNEFNPLATPTPISLSATITGTVPAAPPSTEYKLTNGVILAVVTIVLIILIGTITWLHIHSKEETGENSSSSG